MITRASRNVTAVLVFLCVTLLLACVTLTVVSAFGTSGRKAEYELAHLALEDVVHRVDRGVTNLRLVRALSDEVGLSRARTFARIIADKPSLLEPAQRNQFDSYARTLGVDELHVTDGKGILVRSFPSVYEGRDMAGSSQSAAFLPALTNLAFELAQEPQGAGLTREGDGIDKTNFQYVGVARRDRPGIVQIGYRAKRVAEAMKFADIAEIAENTHVGREGYVRITPTSAGDVGPGVRHVRDEHGRPVVIFDADTSGYRVSVVIPETRERLSGEGTFELLFVLDLIAALLLIVSIPAVRRILWRDIAMLPGLLVRRTAGSRSFARALTSPSSLIALVVFSALVAVLWVSMSRQAYRAACERLRAAAADIVEDLDDCVGQQLAFVGKTICDLYSTPERMVRENIRALMEVYGLDELNAIDARGICVASTVPGVAGNDQWKKVNPAKFNKALLKEGQTVFAQAFRESADEPGVFYKYVGVAFPPPAQGYLQLGFQRQRLQDSIDYSLAGIASHRHIGERGFYLISKTKNGDILSSGLSSLAGKTLASAGFDVFAARNNQNLERRDPVSQEFLGFDAVRFFQSDVNGELCLCTTGVSNQFHRYIAAIPYDEIYSPVLRTTVLAALTLFVVLILVVFFMNRLSDKNRALKVFIEKDKEQREKDLSVATTIQMSSLPAVFPNETDWKLFARMDTAREVGGDFYDFFFLPDGNVFFLIADVSGKGIPAAMFMMKAKTTLRSCVQGDADLATVVQTANDRLAENNDAEMFVTAWIGIYDPATGAVEYVNAGHNPPLVKRANGTVEWVRGKRGLVLAAMPGMKYNVQKLTLEPGDSLCLYTDGVTEATNPALELYGEVRLEETLRRAGPLFVEEIRHDVTTFANGAEQADDITLLALDRKSVPTPSAG